MCLHERSSPTPPPAELTRRNVLAGAAAMAGVTGALVASSGSAGATAAASETRSVGRPPVQPAWPRPVVISGGNLVDPLTGEVTEGAVVVMARGRVVASGTQDDTRAARRGVEDPLELDATGRWVGARSGRRPRPRQRARRCRRGPGQDGATSARSGSSRFFQDVALKELPRWAPGTSPRIIPAGMFVTPELGDTVLADPDLAPLAALTDGVRTPQELRYLTRVNVARGADVVKTRANPRAGIPEQDPTELVYDREQLAAVVSAAGRGACCATPTARRASTAPSGPGSAASSTASSSPRRPSAAWPSRHGFHAHHGRHRRAGRAHPTPCWPRGDGSTCRSCAPPSSRPRSGRHRGRRHRLLRDRRRPHRRRGRPPGRGRPQPARRAPGRHRSGRHGWSDSSDGSAGSPVGTPPTRCS